MDADPGKAPQNPTNPDKSPTQPAKKYRKILPKSEPGGSPGASGIAPGAYRSAPERQKRKKTKNGDQKINPTHVPGPVLGDLGTRPGGQNRRKTGPGTKKSVRRRRRRRFSVFVLAGAVRSRSPDRFLEGPTLENPIISTVGARF